MAGTTKDIPSKQTAFDYEGDEGKRLRAEADEASKKRDQLKAKADAEFLSGNKDAGFKLVAESKAAGEQIHVKNKEAAIAILKFHNEGKGDAYLDIRGLRLEEAIEATITRFNELEAKPFGTSTDLELITGPSRPSASWGIVLKPSCEKLVLDRNYTFKNLSAAIGSFRVTVPGRGKKNMAKQQATDSQSTTPADIPPSTSANENLPEVDDKNESANVNVPQPPVGNARWCAIM